MDWLQALGWNKNHIEELRFTGFSFLREGKYERALIYFEALVILDPTSSYDKQTLGAIYLEKGDAQKALKYCEEALALTPQHEPTLLNKAKALLSLNKQEALKLIHQLCQSSNVAIASDAQALQLAYS